MSREMEKDAEYIFREDILGLIEDILDAGGDLIEIYNVLLDLRAKVDRKDSPRLQGEGVKRHFFIFRGVRKDCGNPNPHPPHLLWKDPEIVGIPDFYCLGREGIIEKDGRKYKLKIVIRGSGWSLLPHSDWGYYYYEPLSP